MIGEEKKTVRSFSLRVFSQVKSMPPCVGRVVEPDSSLSTAAICAALPY